MQPDDVALCDPDVRRRHRRELAPQLVERVAVQAPRARFEPGRVDQVRCTHLRHVHDQVGMPADEHAGGAGMVEVDVREQQVTHVLEREAALREPLVEALDAGRRPAVEERRAVIGLDEEGSDRPRVAQVKEVDRLQGHRRGPYPTLGGRQAGTFGPMAVTVGTLEQAEAVAPAASRLWELDAARTVAIAMMVVFHASYDVDLLAPGLGVEPREGGLRLLQLATGSLFLGLVGVSFTVSTARARERGLGGRELLLKQWRRAAEILAAALAVSAVTWALLDERYIRFGILHLIAVALFLAPFLARLGAWNLLLAAALVAAGPLAADAHSDVPGLLPLGIRPEEGRVGVDWYPIVPWLAPFLVGLWAGGRLYPRGRRGAWGRRLPAPDARTARLAGAPGRHSLAVYLGHQAVLLPLVAAVLLAAGVDVEW